MSDIIGVRPLIALRKIHRKPVFVFLNVGYKPQSVDIRFPWHIYGNTPELFIAEPNSRVDLRPLVGLRVIMLAPAMTAEVVAMFDRLKTFVESVLLHIAAFGDDVDSVMVWDKRYGKRMLGDITNG